MYEFWNMALITLSDGNVLRVGQLVIVLTVVVGGFFLSSIISRLVGRRLTKASSDEHRMRVTILEVKHISFDQGLSVFLHVE